MWKRITDSPLTSGLITLLAGYWFLFTDKKIPDFLADNRWVLAMIPWYYTFIGALGVVAVGLYLILIRDVRAKRKAVGWLEAVADKDSDQMNSRIHLSDAIIIKKELSIPEPYVEISFDILNASVYTLTLTQEVEGKIHFCGNPLHFSPEVSVRGRSYSNLTLTHADRFSPILRQRLSVEVAQQMLQEKRWQIETGHVALWFTYQDRSDTLQKVRVSIGNLLPS